MQVGTYTENKPIYMQNKPVYTENNPLNMDAGGHSHAEQTDLHAQQPLIHGEQVEKHGCRCSLTWRTTRSSCVTSGQLHGEQGGFIGIKGFDSRIQVKTDFIITGITVRLPRALDIEYKYSGMQVRHHLINSTLSLKPEF